MKILVTGGAGFIGSHLVDKLMQEGYEVKVVDDLSAGSLKNVEKWRGNKNFEFLEGDLRKLEIASKAVEDVEVVFHLAANPEVRISSEKPEVLFETNVIVTYNLLEASRKVGVKYFIFTSSSTVYGDAEVFPTPENYNKLEPISIYGACKLAAESLISGYSHTFGIRSLILRLANIVGRRSNHGVIYDFINKLIKNKEVLEILGDGTQKKSYLHVNDLVEAMLFLFNRFKEDKKIIDVYNIGNEDWITVKEIAEIVSKTMNLNPKFIFTGGIDGRGWKGDVKFMLLDITKAKLAGWRPKMSSYEAVKRATIELLEDANYKY